ncbi:hypothetical protein GCM10010910_07530 [Microbacterium nanhaiense]|uniref:Uncharacterized protein n=1 Tax=Microbacterium nanhaiense TaxID=1301026 RepID=A0ABQ2N009_9MICO|nr:hypothetical protein GCM10010910_07530 [Microbacterium nanhaiense]
MQSHEVTILFVPVPGLFVPIPGIHTPAGSKHMETRRRALGRSRRPVTREGSFVPSRDDAIAPHAREWTRG